MGRTQLRERGVNPDRLTDKQLRFVMCYVLSLNAKEAAIEAGYSPRTAAAQGAKLLKNPLVNKSVGKLLKEETDESKLTLKGVLGELYYSVHRDPLDLCDENGRFQITDMRKIPKRIRHTIDGIKVRNHYDREGDLIHQDIELKLTSKNAAIDMALRYLGAYAPDKHEHQVLVDWDKALNATQHQTDLPQLLTDESNIIDV